MAKQCFTCTLDKDISCFSKRTSSSDGLLFQCKECRHNHNTQQHVKEHNNAARKIDRAANLEEYRAQAVISHAKRASRLFSFKHNAPCLVLQSAHTDPL